MKTQRIYNGDLRTKFGFDLSTRNKRFTTARGWLTRYALACGYLEREQVGPFAITLGLSPGGFYEVELYQLGIRDRASHQTHSIKSARAQYRKFHRAALLLA
jgi:hypothetical protein